MSKNLENAIAKENENAVAKEKENAVAKEKENATAATNFASNFAKSLNVDLFSKASRVTSHKYNFAGTKFEHLDYSDARKGARKMANAYIKSARKSMSIDYVTKKAFVTDMASFKSAVNALCVWCAQFSVDKTKKGIANFLNEFKADAFSESKTDFAADIIYKTALSTIEGFNE